MVAQQLGKSASEIDPDQTFAAVGADDLDLVEITLQVEDTFGIELPDESLVNAVGATDASDLRTRLTVRAFAAVAETGLR